MKIFLVMLFPICAWCQDTTYTMDIKIARKLIHDAVRSYVQDSIIALNEQQITILEYQYGKLSAMSQGLAQNHQQQIELERGRAGDFKQMMNVYKTEWRKEKRIGRLKLAGIVVGIGVGIIIGSQINSE